MNGLNVAVIGAGIAGYAAAIALRRTGHHVTHFERGDAHRAEGAGLVLHALGLNTLRSLAEQSGSNTGSSEHVKSGLARGVVLSGVTAKYVQGGERTLIRYASEPVQALGIPRSQLIDILSGIDNASTVVQFNSAIESVDFQTGALRLLNESSARHFDLVVVAEGANSMCRAALPEAYVEIDRPYPYQARVCLLPRSIVESRVAADCAVRQVFDAHRHLSIWPVSATHDALAWSTWIGDPFERVSLSQWIPILAQLDRQVAMQLEEAVESVWLLRYKYREVRLRRWHHGRTVFIGDAAHAMSPQLGLGASLAIRDGVVVARHLRGVANDASVISRALQDYEDQTKPTLDSLQTLCHKATEWVQSPSLRAGLARRVFLQAPIPQAILGSMLQSTFSLISKFEVPSHALGRSSASKTDY